MYQSYISYRACGGGLKEADRLVKLIHNAGTAAGFYGARIGEGNTVVVLARHDTAETLPHMVDRYQQEAGCNAALLAGASSAAMALGVLWLIHDTPL